MYIVLGAVFSSPLGVWEGFLLCLVKEGRGHILWPDITSLMYFFGILYKY